MFEHCKPKVKSRSIHGTKMGVESPERSGMHFRLRVTLFCLLVLASQVGMATPAKKKKSAQQPPPAPVQEAPPIPQPPPTPEQMPAVPPQVSMNDGMLTISAENSTMGDILNAVRKQTGAVLEVPPTLSSERVAAKIGPGNPQSVVQQLFAGSKFDYIIVGSPENPDALQKIIVTPRGAAAGGSNVASYRPPSQSTYQPPPDTADAMEEEPQPEPEPMPAPPEEQQPVTPPTQAQPYSNQPKTPEQLLQELQQMQQQQQGRPPRGSGPQPPPEPQ